MGATNTDCKSTATNDCSSGSVQNGGVVFQLSYGGPPAFLNYWSQDKPRTVWSLSEPDDGACSFTLQSDTRTCRITADPTQEILCAFYPDTSTCQGVSAFTSGWGNYLHIPCQTT